MHPYLLELALSCALVDAGFTWHRMNIHPSLELNPFVRWMVSKLGTGVAVCLGVLGIQALLAVFMAFLPSPVPLSIYTGMGLNRSLMQLKSIELETQMSLQTGSPVPLPSPDSRHQSHQAEKHYGQC